VVAILVVAMLSAVGGVPVMYDPDRAEYGWEGAQDGMLFFVFLGIMIVWPFPAIALAGAAVGTVPRLFLRKRIAVSETAAPHRHAANPRSKAV
jgi:hypothetical protein